MESDAIASLKRDLIVEKMLYANMREVLMKREDEITQLYKIINDLMTTMGKHLVGIEPTSEVLRTPA